MAQEINISESVIRRICKKNNYVFNRADKVYLLAENNTGTPQETPKENKAAAPQEQSNNNYFTREEIKGIKELLAVKEELLSITPGNKNTISVIDILNIDRSNRKKATFNMDIEQLNRLETYNSNPNISKSDIVNIALREYIRNNQGNN